jgi:hypothetical protein
MTFPVVRQPNIGDGLDDQTSISLTLFNLILETTHNCVELHHSWEVIARDVRIHEQWEAQQRQARNHPPQ